MSFETTAPVYPAILLGAFLAVYFIRQRISTKFTSSMKNAYWVLLLLQLFSGIFGYDSFLAGGSSGFSIAINYPQTFLWLYFLLVLIQVVLVGINWPTITKASVFLSFINTLIFFAAMILYSNIIGFQAVSLASLTAIFSNLLANVAGSFALYKSQT